MIKKFMHRNEPEFPEEVVQERKSPLDVRLIVGIGNPGGEYSGNRHNVGFWAVNRLARRHKLDFKHSRTASVAEGMIDGRPVTIVKPRTFVNRSGDAVGPLFKKLKLQPQQLLVIYDELDLPSATVRLRPKGSGSGHNGMKSIIGAIGSNEFPRIRVGIGRPLLGGEPTWEPEVVAGYVLGNPPPDERKALEDAVDQAASAVELAISDSFERAMNQFNR
jgi:peptidyl-tRNA hydrolase, PTH1 family